MTARDPTDRENPFQPLSDRVFPEVNAEPVAPLTPAEFRRRLGAAALDAALLSGLWLCLMIGLGLFAAGARGVGVSNAKVESVTPRLAILGTLMTAWLYFAIMEGGPNGATVGKRTVGIRVVGRSGRPLGFGGASLRFAAKMLSAGLGGLGFLVALLPWRRALHDFLADTLVVRA
jgi:uncharacterized RDD family membrane protein YckC